MDIDKKRQLEASGWKVGNTQEFLHLTAEQMTIVEDSLRERSKLAENPVQHYLVKYESDWADEMDIEGLALLTNKDKEYFETLNLSEDRPLVHCVGTNEYIYIEYTDRSQLLNCYKWISISPEEYKILERLIGTNYGHFFYPEDLEENDERL